MYKDLISKIAKNKYQFKRGIKKNIGDFPLTYLSKPTVIDFYSSNVWPEFAVLSEFKRDGYMGIWVDTFHKKLWKAESKIFKLKDLPTKLKKILTENKKGCWDVIVWKGRQIKFIEVKGIPSRDKIRETQINFLNNMLAEGFNINDFIIVEWDYRLE